MMYPRPFGTRGRFSTETRTTKSQENMANTPTHGTRVSRIHPVRSAPSQARESFGCRPQLVMPTLSDHQVVLQLQLIMRIHTSVFTGEAVRNSIEVALGRVWQSRPTVR
ncbi:hypothetical protein CGRA01v4_08206 [Colletotrichum graminicola]|nr:hypothetical protein CGRA01v4_08206 [Colletotrichum graminicola]